MEKLRFKIHCKMWSCSLWQRFTNIFLSRSWIIHGKGSHRAWKPRLRGRREAESISGSFASSRVVWDCSPNNCGVRPHRKLNMERRPIAKKYCEGKVKRTLKRESKELEIVKREAKPSEWSLIFWKVSNDYSGDRRPCSRLRMTIDGF